MLKLNKKLVSETLNFRLEYVFDINVSNMNNNILS